MIYRLFSIFITAALCLLSGGCEELDGGPVFDEIYVYEDGNLIDAQNLVIELPASGGFIEKEFVTYGIRGLRSVKPAEGLSAELLSSYPPTEDELYEAGEYLSRYKQTIRFKAEPNNGRKSRKAKIMVSTDGYNGYAAYVYINQASAE